jgi:class 3 adenylate cyclase/tetratricopeptide (TPR) repeat protein
MVECPACGEENPDRFRLCGFCGARLREDVEQHEVRKTVSIVFCDLQGSTQLGESLDSETLRLVMSRYFDEMLRALERHGGHVEKFIGDAVMAVFGLPVAHEDDAVRAVRAAWDMKRALEQLNAELERRFGVRLANRTGVNTGEVVADVAATGQRLATGDAVNVAARLEQAAPAGEILLGQDTYRLVREAADVQAVEPLELKGKSQPVPAYLLLGVRSAAQLSGRGAAPLVGRRVELQALRNELGDAIASGECRMVSLLAQAGVGKTRLVDEFLDGLPAGTVTLRGGCLSYGEGITFWPLADAIRRFCGIVQAHTTEEAAERIAELPCEEDARTRLAAVMGISGDTFRIDETFWAVRQLLRGVASDGPVVVVFEDLHWAEPTFLELIVWLIENGLGAPVLIVTSSRPDLLERMPDWCTGPGALRLALKPLSARECIKHAEHMLGSALDAGTAERIARAAEGNPLFVEHMLSMLLDDGVLMDAGDRWVATRDLASIEVPPTIQALLAARIDRLPDDERGVLEPSSVIGRVFYRTAVERLTGADGTRDVDAHLGALIRKEFIARDIPTFVMGDTYRFGHALTRDATYRGLLKRRRAELHEGFADWVIEQAGSRLPEFDEIVAYHLEQAVLYRLELGPLDDAGAHLALRASSMMETVGLRAFARGDMVAAGSLLRRATALMADDDPRRLGLAVAFTEVLVDLGEFAEATSMLDRAAGVAEGRGDVLRATEIELARLVVRDASEPDAWSESEDQITQAIAEFERLGHHAGLAKAWRLLAVMYASKCRFADAEHAVTQTIDHANAAGDSLLMVRNAPAYSFIWLAGPTPVPQAIERCRALIEESAGDRRTEGAVLCALAPLEAMEGRFFAARSAYRRAQQILGDLGLRVLASSTSLNSGPVEMLAGDPAAAERELRRDRGLLEGMGDRYFLPCVIAYLAQAVLAQGRVAEAEELALRSAELSAADDIEAQSVWRRVSAQTRAESGAVDEAVQLARDAAEYADRTDSPTLRGDALYDLAVVLGRCGKAEEAAAVAASARELYVAKGNLVAVGRLSAAFPAGQENSAPARR